jgi:phosphatidylserine decarboxylase
LAVTAPAIVYLERATGRVLPEPNLDEGFLRWYYAAPGARWARDRFFTSAFLSHAYGLWKRLPWSQREIPAFIETFGLDAAEFAEPVASYGSFNAFFERRLRPEARPFAPDPERLPAPADGKVLVVPHMDVAMTLPIKGARVSLAGLLASDDAARPFVGGAALVIRLAPQDYHRFHFPDAGNAAAARAIPGRYHSVNPMAIAAVPGLFCANKRMVTAIETEAFGPVAMIEVGAMTVGTIVQTFTPGRVARGQEKGTFRFGGSTVVLLFAPGRLVFDADLLAASARGLEVHVRAGEAIGTACPA